MKNRIKHFAREWGVTIVLSGASIAFVIVTLVHFGESNFLENLHRFIWGDL